MIEHELNGDIDDLFIDIDLENVLGAASIAQVHKGTWKATGETVAIKLQYPNAEVKMRKDLSNIRFLAEFLQKTELKFDVVSAVKELQSQIKFEFDFKREAANMDFANAGLRKAGVKNVAVPRSVLASDRVLVMSYIEGTNLSQLSEIRKTGSSSSSSAVPAVMRRAVGKKLFQQLAAVYGAMFFTLNKMHADPNPGNISLQGTSIGILDWGQVKDVTSSLKRRFSNLVLAFNARDRDAICKALFALGVKVTYPQDRATVEGIAVTMLDTRKMDGFPCDPFDENCASLRNPIILMPPEIYFIVRSVQMLRGLTSAFDLDFSLAEYWGPLAEQYADEAFIAAKAKAKTKART
jgi:aarF domain-containing kinase